MSAETLRKAAALMRLRAQAAGDVHSHAPDGRWEYRRGHNDVGADGGVFWQADSPSPQPPIITHWEEDGEHIASWHPGVALYAAVWLDSEAELGTYRGQHHPAALAFARAYLGGVSR